MESYSAVLLVSGHDNWPSFKSNLQLQLECFIPRKATFNFHQPCTLPFPRTVTASAVATGHTAPCPISPSYRFPSQRPCCAVALPRCHMKFPVHHGEGGAAHSPFSYSYISSLPPNSPFSFFIHLYRHPRDFLFVKGVHLTFASRAGSVRFFFSLFPRFSHSIDPSTGSSLVPESELRSFTSTRFNRFVSTSSTYSHTTECGSAQSSQPSG